MAGVELPEYLGRMAQANAGQDAQGSPPADAAAGSEKE